MTAVLAFARKFYLAVIGFNITWLVPVILHSWHVTNPDWVALLLGNAVAFGVYQVPNSPPAVKITTADMTQFSVPSLPPVVAEGPPTS